MPYLPRHKIKNCKAKILAYFMTEIRPPKTLNHIFPEKVFYAFSLKNHRSICRKSGAGPALARLRILCTQKIRSPSSFCFDSVYCIRKRSRARAHFAPIAYTVYAKDPGPGSFCLVCVYYVRKGFGARAQTASSAYTMYAKDSGPGSFCLVCVYYVRKRSRARAQAASSAYTMYAKKQGLGCSDNF